MSPAGIDHKICSYSVLKRKTFPVLVYAGNISFGIAAYFGVYIAARVLRNVQGTSPCVNALRSAGIDCCGLGRSAGSYLLNAVCPYYRVAGLCARSDILRCVIFYQNIFGFTAGINIL